MCFVAYDIVSGMFFNCIFYNKIFSVSVVTIGMKLNIQKVDIEYGERQRWNLPL